MLHLLRQDSVTAAVEEHPNSVAISRANAKLLRGLGTGQLEEMVRACRRGTAADAEGDRLNGADQDT